MGCSWACTEPRSWPGSLYHTGGQALAAAFGAEILPRLEFAAYVALFAVAFGVIGLLIWRAYPMSRLSRRFGMDNVLGAGVATLWGILFLIALLTILRFYAVVPWNEQEATQQSVLRQIQTSQVAVVLELVAAPLWQVMVPWFPTQVPPSYKQLLWNPSVRSAWMRRWPGVLWVAAARRSMTRARPGGTPYEPKPTDDPRYLLGVPVLRRPGSHGATSTRLRDVWSQRRQLRAAARGVGPV